jgi:DNA-binding winged helix-turn-helix (wHTH) protein
MKFESAQDRNGSYEFAGFRLDVNARRLLAPGDTAVKLNSRAFDTLAVLVARRGETLTKRFLLEAVWPHVVVGDNNLNQAVAAIRKALGDNGATRRIIQTIPGRGFCFVAEAHAVTSATPSAAQEPASCETIVTVADYF